MHTFEMTTFRLISLLGCLVSYLSADTAPRFPVFTYAGDPSTTLTVNWQTTSELSSEPVIRCSLTPREDSSTDHFFQGETSQIEGLNECFIHRVQLNELTPNTTYYISIGDEQSETTKEYKVLTIPDDETSLRFVTGGDMGTSKDVRTLLRHSASWDPHFAVVGGDVAYANGDLKKSHLWDLWLTYYTEEMVTSDGYTIPLVVTVGNHETQGMFAQTFKKAPYLPALFGQDMEKNHFSRRFGKNLGMLILDSNHTASHASQVPWMREELQKFQDAPHTVAVYHVPLFPSHRGFMEIHSRLGRQHWAPVFDEMGLTVAFENHDHTQKRTHLIKGGKVSGDKIGTLYLGDGCWGRSTRAVSYGGRWYLKAAIATQHFWCVDVSKEQMVYRAVDIENRVFDIYPEDHPESAAATKIREGLKDSFIFPTDSVHCSGFPFQEGDWDGGTTSIVVTNTLKEPMNYTLHAIAKGNRLSLKGFTKKEYSLEPGEKKEHEVSFKPKGKISLSKLQPGYRIEVELQRPKEKPLKLQTAFKIPILPVGEE